MAKSGHDDGQSFKVQLLSLKESCNKSYFQKTASLNTLHDYNALYMCISVTYILNPPF